MSERKDCEFGFVWNSKVDMRAFKIWNLVACKVLGFCLITGLVGAGAPYISEDHREHERARDLFLQLWEIEQARLATQLELEKSVW